MNGFNQAFPLNLMTIWTFFDNGLWFHASFKFLMCIKYSFYHASFHFFKFPFFQEKRINYCESHILFQRYWTSTLGNYPSSISSLRFSIKSLQNWVLFWIHLKLLNGNFWDSTHLCKLFSPSHYLRHDDSLFLS